MTITRGEESRSLLAPHSANYTLDFSGSNVGLPSSGIAYATSLDASGNSISGLSISWSQLNQVGTLDNATAFNNFINNLPSNTETLEINLGSFVVTPHAGTNTVSIELLQNNQSLGTASDTWTRSHDCNASIFDPNPQC